MITVDIFLSQFVTFDSVETYQQKPFINLEVGKDDRKAIYVGGDNSRTLRFEYTVQPGDVSYDLEYVDSHSFETGLDDAAERVGRRVLASRVRRGEVDAARAVEQRHQADVLHEL